MQKITATLIVRNESELLLKCLESVKDADYFVIVDTGSEDNTKEIAADFLKDKKGKLYDFKWIDDFAAARNFAQSKVKSKWVLIIDADETLEKGAMAKIKKAIQGDHMAINVTVDTDGEIMRSPRIMKRNIKWKYAAHNVIEYVGKCMDLDILIKGVAGESRLKDPDRTLRILTNELKKDPDNLRNIYYLSREYLNRNEIERVIYWLNKYLEINTNYTSEAGDSLFILGTIYCKMGEYMKGIEYLFKAIMYNPNHKDAWITASNFASGKYKDTLIKFSQHADNSLVQFNRNIK